MAKVIRSKPRFSGGLSSSGWKRKGGGNWLAFPDFLINCVNTAKPRLERFGVAQNALLHRAKKNIPKPAKRIPKTNNIIFTALNGYFPAISPVWPLIRT